MAGTGIEGFAGQARQRSGDAPQLPMTEPADPRRHLDLPGAVNLRDVGGYPGADGRLVRPRTMLRSGGLHGLGDSGRTVLADLGLRTVVDLREDFETAKEPDALGTLPVVTRRVPIYSDAAGQRAAAGGSLPIAGWGTGADSGATAALGAEAAQQTGAATSLEEIYNHMVDRRGHRLAAAVRALGAPGALPALVHCSAGKDRTGLVVALVLDVVGVADDTIAADFALTRRYLHDEAAAALRRLATSAAGDAFELPAGVMDSPPELILASLARIRSAHGDSRGYLLNHGMAPDELDRLTGALLAEPI